MRVETIREPGFALLPRLEQRSLIVKFTGNGDMDAVQVLGPHLKSVHQVALSERVTEVIYDLSELYFLNSSCLKAFVAWIHEVHTGAAGYKIRFLTNANLHWQRRSLDALRRLAPATVQIEAREG